MKKEYDFSKAERGKFFRPGAELVPPIHLDPEVMNFLSDKAKSQGTTLSDLVNLLLKHDIELLKKAG